MRERKYACLFYMNEKENKHFLNQLSASGITKSEFLRKLIMKTNIQPKPSEKINEIYRLVANIANNTNQIAKIANSTGQIDSKKINGLLIMVDKCWQMIKEIS